VVGKGSVNLDFVFLQPGEWGRFQGLSVLKSGADLLLEMGIKAVRVVRPSHHRPCHLSAEERLALA